MGLGLGIILSTIILFNNAYNYKVSDAEVEKRALQLGMSYDDNKKIKVGEDKLK